MKKMIREANKNDLMTFIEKNGAVCNFEFQKPNQILSRIKAITNAYKVNIDNVTIMNTMLCGCLSLKESILDNFNIINVIDMSNMFL